MADEHKHGDGGGGHAKGGHGGGHGHGGGGHEEGHEGAPEWLISFADNVMLQMGFFVILLALNMKPTPTTVRAGEGGSGQGGTTPSVVMLDFAIAVREAFNNPVDLNSSDPNDLPLVQRLKQLKGTSEAQDDGMKGRDRDVQTIRPAEFFGQGGRIQFADRSADLDPAARDNIEAISKKLRGLRYIIDVRGHVSAAEAYQQPDRAASLSYQRARTVAEALVKAGIGWESLSLVACADNDRLVPTAYELAEHRTNQRVEVIVSDRMLPDYVAAPAEDKR
ncbi:MAG: OmpA family protein [Phycisphaerae bacterium]